MKQIYKLTNTPGLEGVEFTESSKKDLFWPEAVKFAADQNAILQSVREAGAFRIEAEGKYDADNTQATRTGVIYFKDGSKFYVAFDDIPDARQNIILACVQEGYDASSKRRELLVSKKDKQIAQLLKRAEKNDRIGQIAKNPVENALDVMALELATKASAGSSEFGSNKVVQALFGDVAELYAGMLHKRNYDKGCIYLLVPESLDKQVAGDKAIIQPVSLSGDDDIAVVLAGNVFSYTGGARGVRGAKAFQK